MSHVVFEGEDTDIIKKMEINEIPESIYYYTNIDAFYNIVLNNQLWFGCTASMNDINEMTDFVIKLKNRLLQKYADDKSSLDKVNEIFDSLILKYPYAMCFSKYEDNAAQWERYADYARGICIKFDSFKLLKLLYYSGGHMRAISYDYEPSNHAIYTEIIEYISNGVLKWGTKEKCIQYIREQIQLIANMRKHKSFITEGEIRFSTVWDMCFKDSYKEYKSINGVIREFVILELGKYFKNRKMSFEDIITEIRIGPRSMQTMVEIKGFLCNNEYDFLADRVYKSDCALRR